MNVIEGKLSVNMTYWIILFNWPLPSYAVILDKDDSFFQIEDEYKCKKFECLYGDSNLIIMWGYLFLRLTLTTWSKLPKVNIA